MKKAIFLILVLTLFLSLCACGDSKTSHKDYSGTWVRETWTNEETGEVVDITVYLHEDGSFIEKKCSSVNGNKTYEGTWQQKSGKIILNILKLTEGSEPLKFDENGNIREGIGESVTLRIIDKNTLENGGNQYHKEMG